MPWADAATAHPHVHGCLWVYGLAHYISPSLANLHRSCTLCRRRKIRCNREQPCSNCLRARKNVACVYEELPLPSAANGGPAQPSITAPPTQSVSTSDLDPPRGNGSLTGAGIVVRGPSTSASGPGSQRTSTPSSASASADMGRPDHHHTGPPPQRKQKQTGPDVQSLQQRIWQLERQLQENHAETAPSTVAMRIGFPGAVSEESQTTPVSYITLSDPPMHSVSTRHARGSRSRSSRSTSPAQGSRRRHTRSRSPPRNTLGCPFNPKQGQVHPMGPPPVRTHSAANSGGSSHPRAMADDFHVTTVEPRDGRSTKSATGSVTKRGKGGKGGKQGKESKGNKSRHDASRQDRLATYPHRHMHMTSRSVMHKTRLFGQSHWVNSIVGFRDIFEMIDPLVAAEEHSTLASKVFVDMQRLKHLGRVVKAQRIGPTTWAQWAPTSLGIPTHLHHINPEVQPIRQPEDLDLPSRALADELVACYLRSTESMYRILHVPMFRREYAALWQTFASSSSLSSPTLNKKSGIAFAKSDSAFVAQLKLVLAIGASTHPDHIGLRARAVRWFYAAQAWHAEPEYKAHLTMQTLQIHVLLLLAREAVSIGGALIWIAVGDLVRSAVYMGLHRDPSNLPKRMSLLAAEMRRRLWNTILELVVATSIDAGGPVMLSLSDFDARPPENLDDDALEEASIVSMPPPPASIRDGVPTCIETDGNVIKADGGAGGAGGLRASASATARGVPKRVYVSDGEMRGVPPYETVTEMIEAEMREGMWEDGRDERADGAEAETDKTDERERERRAPQRNPAVCALNIREESDDEADDAEEGDDGEDDSQGDSEDDGRTPSGEHDCRDASASPAAFTQTSVAIALRRTLSLRLLICKFVNSMGPPGSYADTLHFDRKFREAYRGLCETMQQYNSGNNNRVSPFVLSSVDLLMRRYVLCLHIPFFGAAMQDETAYAYSRRVVVDTALRIWHTGCPGIVDAAVATKDAAGAAAADRAVDPELVRQSMLGCGPLRRLSMQASLLVAAEIKLQLLEEEGILGAPSSHKAAIRPDLLAVLEAATLWCLRSIEAGETNFKGYLLWRLIMAQLDGMRRGMMGTAAATVESRMALARELVQVAEEAEAICMPIMEGMVTSGYQEMGLLGAGPGAVPTLVAAEGTSPASTAAPAAPAWTHSEVHAIARSCRVEGCPCQAPYREQLEREQREKQQREALEALEEQQQAYKQMQAQAQVQVPMPFSTMPFANTASAPVLGGPQTLDPMDLTVDNWEFLMPSDPPSLGMGNSEPLSWLFSGDAAQGILW